MATANINMHALELGDFGKLRKTIPMAAKKNIALGRKEFIMFAFRSPEGLNEQAQV